MFRPEKIRAMGLRCQIWLWPPAAPISSFKFNLGAKEGASVKQTGIFRALSTAENDSGAPRPQRHTTGARHSQLLHRG